MTKNNTQDGYEGLLTWYTRMAQPSKFCASDSTISANDPQNTRVPNLASVHSTPNGIYQPTTNTPIDQLTDQYPFDFDLLNADGNTALFTPNFHGLGNTENELLRISYGRQYDTTPELLYLYMGGVDSAMCSHYLAG
jgi:hypothetical protein